MVRKLDKWCDIDWIIFICVTGVITAVCAALFWDNMPLGAQGAVFAAVIMPFHVLEEWKFPGGLHHFYNTLLGPKEKNRQDLSRYPMSLSLIHISGFPEKGSAQRPPQQKHPLHRFSAVPRLPVS